MKKHIIIAVRMLGFMTLLTGVVYPLTITGVARVLFAEQANGSLIERDKQTVGSALLGQTFEKPEHFWSRPSAVNYNPLPSGGSNQGQASEALKASVAQRTEKLKAAHGEEDAVPQDLVFASGSGLDPHISVAAAEYQVKRVAKAKAMEPADIEKLIHRHTTNRAFGFLGEPVVNVLELNLELDAVGR